MFNSDQVNYIIYRYLTEAGFVHAAFNLKAEWSVAEKLQTQWGTRVPSGRLVDIFQRALLFDECMAQVNEVREVSIRVRLIAQRGEQKDPADVAPVFLIPGAGTPESNLPQKSETNGHAKRKADKLEAPGERKRRTSPAPPTSSTVAPTTSSDQTLLDFNPKNQGSRPEAVKVITEITHLEGHASSSEQVRWNPTRQNVVASSSDDGLARIWTLPSLANEQPQSVVLQCAPSRTGDKSVTALSWNGTGTLIATGSYDGTIRLWTATGGRQHRDFTFHTGPVFAIKWARRGDFFLSASADGNVGVWNVASGSLQQRWELNSPVMDIEWISDALFLSACRDGNLKMWQLGREAQVKQFLGHKMEINVLKWNSNINLGATGGNDNIVKIWRADSDKPTQVLTHHHDKIQAIEWAPRNQGDYRIVASASKDGKVCVWDAVRGELLHTLVHDRAIMALTFSVDNILACAGEEGEVTVWEVVTGKMIAHTRPNLGVVYNIRFNQTGSRIAVAGAAKTIAVLALDGLTLT